MPNHVTTRLAFSGPDHVVAALKAAIKTEHPAKPRTAWDGSAVYVRKEGENELVGWLDKDGLTFRTHSEHKRGLIVLSDKGAPVGWEPDIIEAWTHHIDFERILPPPPFIISDSISAKQMAEAPGRNWYDYNSRVWGTKWNSYNTKVDDQGRILMDTAWAFPKPLIEELSVLFPEIEITAETYDEGSCFWGTAVFKGGKILSDTIKPGKTADKDEGKRLARELKGWKPETDPEEN